MRVTAAVRVVPSLALTLTLNPNSNPNLDPNPLRSLGLDLHDCSSLLKFQCVR